MQGLISRQAAVELAMKYCPDDDGAVQCDGDIRGLLDELENLPAAQPESIRCKDCKYMIDTGDDLMCDNAKGWVVATASDFGCVLAERRTE